MIMDRVIDIVDQNGNEGTFDNLATFESRYFKKEYIIFANKSNEEDKIKMFSGTYKKREDGKYEVNTDLSEEEKEMIDEFIDHMLGHED